MKWTFPPDGLFYSARRRISNQFRNQLPLSCQNGPVNFISDQAEHYRGLGEDTSIYGRKSISRFFRAANLGVDRQTMIEEALSTHINLSPSQTRPTFIFCYSKLHTSNACHIIRCFVYWIVSIYFNELKKTCNPDEGLYCVSLFWLLLRWFIITKHKAEFNCQGILYEWYP